MKKLIAILLALLLMCGTVPAAFGADTMNYNKPTASIRIRDPFVLVYDGLYYMYGTGAATGKGYGCYVSPDLENWAGPYNVFSAPADFDGIKDFWAPECRYYNGKFYLFATYFSQTTGHRGVSVFRADSPLGPFTEISSGHATPHDQDSIDGTLYVDPNGQPYMVYVHEWTSTEDGIGRMDVAKLTDDLSALASEPKELFRATSPAWSDSKVTDGPFLYTSCTGKLLMLWSNSSDAGYCVGVAASTGTVTDRWQQRLTRLYRKDKKLHTLDGGHGMLFTDLDGQLTLCIHSPNGADENRFETASFFKVKDLGYTLALDEKPTFGTAFLLWLDRIGASLTDWFVRLPRKF